MKIKFSEEVKAALRTLSKEDRRKYVENAVAQQLAKDKQRTVIVASLDTELEDSEPVGAGIDFVMNSSNVAVVGTPIGIGPLVFNHESQPCQQEWLEAMVQGSKIPFRTRDGLSGSVQIFFEGSDTQEAEVKPPLLDEDSEPVASETPRPIFPTPHPGSGYAAGGSGLGVYPSSGYYAGGGLAPGSGVGGSVSSSGHGYGHGFSSSSGGNPSNEVTKREEIKNAETEGSES